MERHVSKSDITNAQHKDSRGCVLKSAAKLWPKTLPEPAPTLADLCRLTAVSVIRERNTLIEVPQVPHDEAQDTG